MHRALTAAIATELAAYRQARLAGDVASAWIALERAHILSQANFHQHLKVHVLMLLFAVHSGDGREALGQIFRVILVPLGALTGRVPWGNTGRARVSAFTPMPVPDDLRSELFRPRKPRARRWR